MTDEELEYYENLFDQQYGDLPVGGFYNPEIVEMDDREIEFRGHYNNFESEEDSWSYFFDIKTQEFY